MASEESGVSQKAEAMQSSAAPGAASELDLFAPSTEHGLLADALREFVQREVEPQAAQHDREERFNEELFRRAGELGFLGVTIPEAYGGSGLDGVAAIDKLWPVVKVHQASKRDREHQTDANCVLRAV